jgi:hypothetical protein
VPTRPPLLRPLLLGAALAAGLWAPTAHAECKAAYTGAELVSDLEKMTMALRILDETTFQSAGARLETGLPCVGNPIPTAVFASAFRYIGTNHYLNGDAEGSRRWFRASLELDPTFYWDINDLEEGHPLRLLFEEERAKAGSAPVAVEGKELNLPAGSKLLLDGRTLETAAATLDRPHLLQVVGADNSVRQTFLIEGNAIPERFLRAPGAAVAEAEPSAGRKGRKGAEPEMAYGDYEVRKIERVRPAAKTPLMIAGAVTAVGAGGLYAGTFFTAQRFEEATTTDELNRYRSLTNVLVIASGVSLAAGIGIEYAGIAMGASPGLVIGGQF